MLSSNLPHPLSKLSNEAERKRQEVFQIIHESDGEKVLLYLVVYNSSIHSMDNFTFINEIFLSSLVSLFSCSLFVFLLLCVYFSFYFHLRLIYRLSQLA